MPRLLEKPYLQLCRPALLGKREDEMAQKNKGSEITPEMLTLLIKRLFEEKHKRLS